MDKKVSKLLTYKTEYFLPEKINGVKIFIPDENYDYPFFSKKILSEKICDDMVKNFLLNGPGSISAINAGDPKGTVSEYIRNSYNLIMEPDDKKIYHETMVQILPEIEDFFKVTIIFFNR